MLFAKIIIDISSERVDRTFEYIIPKDLEDTLTCGSQVLIPFGNGNKIYTGYVVDISDKAEYDISKLKEIIRINKDSIAIESQLVALAAWMKRQYGGTMNQALKTVIPIKQKQSVKINKKIILKVPLQNAQEELSQLLARKNHSVPKERLLRAIMEATELEWSDAIKLEGVTSSHINDFAKAGLISVTANRMFRNPIAAQAQNIVVDLNEEQKKAISTFVNEYNQDLRNTYLLHGITGSGKTEVYMHMMEYVLNKGKQVIVLIPEISLTYQNLMRFYARFGDRVTVINSKMSPGERFDQFDRAKSGEVSIMIGPRSALFTPFSNLGLIIIDEEHETSYKSEVIPRYHARETAIFRAKLADAAVVLGSATPAVDSYEKALNGQYTLLELKERVANRPLPECSVVDMRTELKSGNRTVISNKLKEELRNVLAKKQQAMLFLNRRGLLGFVSCRSCGEVLKCPHCEVSLSIHNDGSMKCHYCGYSIPQVKQCPKCNSKYIGAFKAGTQKLEEEIIKVFPGVRTLRMDLDTTRGKGDYDKILSAFGHQEADILIGTQMIVKGHDFPNVTLVGVMAADISLNDSNYLSSERTFQLLTQAVGRAGRGQYPGKAVIQTYRPDSYALTCSLNQDYIAFYKMEMAYRKLMKYPPVAHLLLITVTSTIQEDAEKQSQLIHDLITEFDDKSYVLGPVAASIYKINDTYRRNIYIKNSNYESLVIIKDNIEGFLLNQKELKSTNTWFDFDPMSGF